MKPIDTRRYGPVRMIEGLRRRFGERCWKSELHGVLVPDTRGALAKLERRKLVVVEDVPHDGRYRCKVTFAARVRPPGKPKLCYPGEQPGKKQKRFSIPVVFCFMLGAPLREGRSNRTPEPDKLSFVKYNGRIDLVRYVGKIEGGWLVRPE